MAKEINVRTKLDRARYVVIFEILLILMSAPIISMVLERDAMDVGSLAVVISIKAMIVNVIYNFFYDRFDIRAGRIPTERSAKSRLIHAGLFEVILTATSMPIVMWWLDVPLLTALAMDAALMAFIVVYTYVYTWCYDRLFPVAQPADMPSAELSAA